MTEETTTELSEAQRQRLAALLDAILPAGDDGRMPSAAELDFAAYLSGQDARFLALLPRILERFDDAFAAASLPDRIGALEAFEAGDPALFEGLLMKIYDCYYQNDRVRALIGAEPGPPFPRGNVIPAGDLSGLDAVVERSRGYRRVR